MRKKNKKFRLVSFRWLFIVDIILVVGAVMSFGVVAKGFLIFNRENAHAMLFMIPLMVVAVGISTGVTLHSIRKKMSVLLNGIQAVADGELDVQLDTKKADEYTEIYTSFNSMVRELKNTKQEMQSFVNEFSHEFKTPITSIYGFSQLLLDTGDGIETPERLQYLKVISDESLRLSELSQNTLLLSKVDACEIITDKEDYDLSEQIKHCAILLLPKIEQNKIQLELNVNDIRYHGNPELMEQVWINLLSNAVKFTPENGEISITAEQEKNQIKICFSDTGVGMNEETKSHIFEKYYQNDTIHTVRGNGIGLSIVHRIITLCGGNIKVTSSVGEGSKFVVTLPL